MSETWGAGSEFDVPYNLRELIEYWDIEEMNIPTELLLWRQDFYEPKLPEADGYLACLVEIAEDTVNAALRGREYSGTAQESVERYERLFQIGQEVTKLGIVARGYEVHPIRKSEHSITIEHHNLTKPATRIKRQLNILGYADGFYEANLSTIVHDVTGKTKAIDFDEFRDATEFDIENYIVDLSVLRDRQWDEDGAYAVLHSLSDDHPEY